MTTLQKNLKAMLENFTQMSVDQQHAAETFGPLDPAPTHDNPILNARGKVYGSFINNARVSQQLKAAMRAGSSWSALRPDQKEALEQIALKISRIVTGDPDYVDNWDDTAGYAIRVADRLREGAAE